MTPTRRIARLSGRVITMSGDRAKWLSVLCLLILLLPVVASSPGQAMSLERYEKVETLYPYGPAEYTETREHIWAIDWSSDGQYLATSMWCSCSNATKVSDMATGNILFSNSIPYRALLFSPNGKYLAAAEYSYSNLTIFETRNWNTVLDINLHISGITSISWDTSSSYIACAGQNGNVSIIKSDNWEVIKNFTATKDSNMKISWSPNGRYLAIGAECIVREADNITIWDTKNWTMKETLHIDEGEFTWARVYSFAWAPDSSRLVAGLTSYQREAPYASVPLIYVWNTTTWNEYSHAVLVYGQSEAVISIEYTSDARNIIAGLSNIDYAVNTEVLVIEATSLKKLQTVTVWYSDEFWHYGFSVALSPDGNKLAIAGYAVEIYEKRPDYSPLYPYIIAAAGVVIVTLLFMKRRRKNVPNVKLEEREAEDPVQWRFF